LLLPFFLRLKNVNRVRDFFIITLTPICQGIVKIKNKSKKIPGSIAHSADTRHRIADGRFNIPLATNQGIHNNVRTARNGSDNRCIPAVRV